jgi:hypothetical protein
VTEKNRGIVRMQFGDGTELNAWTSFRLRDHFTDPLGSLEFTAEPPRAKIGEYRERLQKGELVTILVNEANQGTYLIQERRTSVGRDGVAFSLNCQTPLVTPYQGGVNPKINLKSQTDVAAYLVVLDALAPYGFDKIVGDNAANVSAMTGRPLGRKGAAPVVVDALKHSEAKAHDGETGYGFASKIFSRLGVALRMAADGTLLLAAPNYEQEAAYSVVQDFDGSLPGDRFLADPPLEIADTNDQQFSECVVEGVAPDPFGSTQTGTPQGRVTAEEMNPGRLAYKSFAAAYKPLILHDKNSRDVQRARSVGKLALGIRAAKAYVVTGYVDGIISKTGRVWTVDTIAHATVVVEDLDEDMWVIGRELSGSKDRSQMTRIELIPKGALVLGEIPS